MVLAEVFWLCISRRDLRRRGAECEPDAKLLRALARRVAEHGVDAKEREHECERRKSPEERGGQNARKDDRKLITEEGVQRASAQIVKRGSTSWSACHSAGMPLPESASFGRLPIDLPPPVVRVNRGTRRLRVEVAQGSLSTRCVRLKNGTFCMQSAAVVANVLECPYL
jgi:hypothetical protein